MNKISQVLKTAIANNASNKKKNINKEQSLSQKFIASHLKQPINHNNTTRNNTQEFANCWRKLKTSGKLQHSLAVLQNNIHLKTEVIHLYEQNTILPLIPKTNQWSFITKYSKKKKTAIRRVNSSEVPIKTIQSATRHNSLLSVCFVDNMHQRQKDSNHSSMKQFMNKAIISSKQNSNVQSVAYLNTLPNASDSKYNKGPIKKSLSTLQIRNMNETCSSTMTHNKMNRTSNTSLKNIGVYNEDYMKKCLYIKYQKLAYMKTLNQSSSISASITTIASSNYAMENYAYTPYKLKCSCENTITINSNVKQISKESSFMNHINQSQTIEDNHQQQPLGQIINTQPDNSFFGYNNITWNNDTNFNNEMISSANKDTMDFKTKSKGGDTDRLLAKKIHCEVFINKKPSECNYDSKANNNKKNIENQRKEIVEKGNDCNGLSRTSSTYSIGKIRAVSPNKQLFTYLFKGKDQLDNKLKSNQSSHMITTSTPLLAEAILSLRSVPMSSRRSNPSSVTSYQIYHNDPINIIPCNNTTIIMPPLEFSSVSTFHPEGSQKPLKASRKEPFPEDSALSPINKADNHTFLSHNMKNDFNQATNSNETNEANFSLTFNTSTPIIQNHINPTNQLYLSLPKSHNTNTSIIINNNCDTYSTQKKEIEKNINDLNPIQTGESLRNQIEDFPMKIHIHKTQVANLLASEQIDYASLSSNFFQSFSIEKILKELISNVKSQHDLIHDLDIYDKSTEIIKMLFHLNNQNTLYVKKLLSIEDMEPQANLQRITIFKRNSTLEDILLYELIEMKTHQEISDNINLIADLINNNDVLLSEALKEYKKYEGKIVKK